MLQFSLTNCIEPFQGGPEKRTCLNVDNSATVSDRKTCYTSKVSEWCRK